MTAEPLIEGSEKSSVRVQIYEDLACPDTAEFLQAFDEEVVPEYGERVAFEHHDFPLPKHLWARPAAIASRYFQQRDPGLALKFRRFTLRHFDQINIDNFEKVLAEFAKEHRVSDKEAIAALHNRELAHAVETDREQGLSRNVSRTPTVFVNDDEFIERFDISEVIQSIDAALAANRA